MLVNQDEALGKWCPMRRITSQQLGTGYNSADENNENLPMPEAIAWCIGEHCMMWRFPRMSEQEYGYCGLAGKPWNAT